MVEHITNLVVINGEFFERTVTFETEHLEVCYVTYRRVPEPPAELDLTPTWPSTLIVRDCQAAGIKFGAQADART